jgi:prolyl 4-hydroxylase
MHYSQVALMDKDKGRPATDFRTSQTTFLKSHNYPFLKEIDNRTSALVRLPINHQEQVQVLRYGYTEKYDSHHDYFDPTLYKNSDGTQKLIQRGRRNRMITVLWYLSDVEEGGETVFPLYDHGPRDFPKEKECDIGLRVQPEVGKVIVFYSQTPDGALDPYSLHGACPVKKGIKWAANKWVWNAPMNYVRDS